MLRVSKQAPPPPLMQPRLRCPRPSKATRAHAKPAPAPEKAPDIPDKVSSSYFPAVISSLLWNAASVVTVRGRASCAVCRTKGCVTCPECGGHRISSKKFTSAKAHAMARLARLHPKADHRQTQQEEWLVTNRCSTCHGAGVIPCPACGGEGYRAIGAPEPPQVASKK